MNDAVKEILIYLYNRDIVKYKDLPTYITDKYANCLAFQNTTLEGQTLQYYKTPFVQSFKITDRGRRILLENITEKETKHLLLDFLNKGNKNFGLAEIKNAFDLPEMFILLRELDGDEAIDLKNFPSKEGDDWCAKINETGIAYLKSRKYLKENPPSTLPTTYHHTDNSVTIIGKDIVHASHSIIESSFNKNEETPESKNISKQGLSISKKTLNWTIAAVVIAILLTLLSGYKQGWLF